MTDEFERPAPDRRMLGIVLAMIAAAALGTSGLTRHWLANPTLDLEFGPLGCHNCCEQQRDCTMSNGDYVEMRRTEDPLRGPEQTSSGFAPMGWITFGACLVAALGLVAAVGVAARNKRPYLRVAPTTVSMLALMIGLITGCVFVATTPGPTGLVGVAWGFWLFGGGCVAGLLASVLLARAIRPRDPDLLDDAMNPDQF